MVSSVLRSPSVSVIIPLEFHRGQAGNCLELWLTGQTHPREDFEIVLVCPPDFPHDQRRAIQEKMAPWDRLVEFPLHHDIALVEQGARLARGAFFFFTESHVLPEPDTLSKVMQAFQDHPEWAGFSLQSVPIVHNYLSRVEADFYELGIRQGEGKPEWCQVLDQCFAVRRDPYFEALGFQAGFGHYSEWVLAARLYARGHVIGYLSEGRIHHYYIGELPDLEEFTADFAVGHWRWFQQTSREPAHALMQEPRILAGRFGYRRSLANAWLKIAWQSPALSGALFRLMGKSWAGLRGCLWGTWWKYKVAKARLLWHCRRESPAALAALIDLSAAVVDMAQIKELMKMPPPEEPDLPEHGEWTPSNETLPILGLYVEEEFSGQAFCWSQPAALAQLNLAPGRYHLELEWLALRPELVEPQLFLNEQPVAREKQRHFKFRVRCLWHHKNNEPLRFGWTCPLIPSAGDTRLLALPLSRISWKRQPSTPLPNPPMPKLREVVSRLLAKQIVRNSAGNPEAAPMAKTVISQQETIERLRGAEKLRSILHRRLKDRVKRAKREARQHKEDAKLTRRELNLSQSLCAEQSRLLDIYRPFAPCRAGEGSGEPFDNLMSSRGRSRKENKAWKSHWMRLGVLCQHPPRLIQAPPVPRTIPDPHPPSLVIVTPSYNQAVFLERTMQSVLGQNYPNLEYVVMDGGSTDESVAVIRKLKEKLSYWQSVRDGGQSAAVQAGFQKSNAELMAWLNSDDVLLPGSLAYVADYFSKHPGVDCVYGHRILINDADHEVGRWYLPPHDSTMLLWADYIPQETWFWRRTAYEKAGGVDPSFRFALDWDLLLRMQRTGAVFKRLPAFLAAFRVHQAQKSQAEIHLTGRNEVDLLRTRELGDAFTQGELERRCTAFQIRALRTMRLWNLGIKW